MNTLKSWDDAVDLIGRKSESLDIAIAALEQIKNCNKAFSHSIADVTLKAIETLLE